MARTSIDKVLLLKDAAQSWNFDIVFPRIPGSVDSQDQVQLQYKCKTANLPSSSIEQVKIDLHGVSKVEAGRAVYQNTMQATFMEVVSWETYSALRRWRQYTRDWKNNTGRNYSEYAVDAEILVYDSAGSVASTFKLVGCWVQEIADIAFEGASSTPIDVSCTFAFQYVDDGISY